MSAIITKSDITCHVDACLRGEGNLYVVRETGFKSESEKVAINNGLAFIRKQVRRRLRILNKERKKYNMPPLDYLPKPGEKIKRVRTVFSSKYSSVFEKRIRTKF